MLSWVIERPKSAKITAETRAPARRGISHESRNSPGISYDYGRHDRWNRVSDPFHLGQGRRQAEPRYRPQIPPGLDRRHPAAHGPRRACLALPEEVRGFPQEVNPAPRAMVRDENAPAGQGRF